MSFECLFQVKALVNRAVNKLETILAQRRELSQNLFSLLKFYQNSYSENKSVSSVYVYVLVLLFCRIIWGKDRDFSNQNAKTEEFFSGKGVFSGKML